MPSNNFYEKLAFATEPQLQEWLANARATCSCIGHWKGERNRYAVEEYTAELRLRGVPVDKSIEGTFNGEGSV